MKLDGPNEQQVADSSDTRTGRRYHDLDSLRAAMMLLGLVFHVAWFFQPFYFWNPISDTRAHVGFLYFFCWVHQFRMQVFFLIAGFFACLLIRKRGHLSFLRNRFLRIVVPFAIAMLTIWPLMKLQYLRGGLVSGRILSDQSWMQQYWTVMSTIDWENEWIVHLWFLHCLLIVYCIAVVLFFLFESIVDRKNRIRPRLLSLINRISESHFGPILLAIPVSICMAHETTWLGIDSGPLKPVWSGVLAYWIFFAVGWCLYQAPQIIDVFARRWQAYLIVGSILSIGLCHYFHHLVMAGRDGTFYPLMTATEIDYPKLRLQLIESSENTRDSDARKVWNHLSPTYQEFIRDVSDPTSDQLSGLAAELSIAVVLNPEFSVDSRLGQSDGGVPHVDESVQNREWLAAKLDGAVSGRWECSVGIKVGYFFGYAFASWMLTFAMLGIFRSFFSHPSRSIRYLADSSYFLYLVHLPLQFEFSIYMANWDANAIVKFAAYNLLTFAVLLPIYHLYVRSTFIGFILNGRTYPLRMAEVEG